MSKENTQPKNREKEFEEMIENSFIDYFGSQTGGFVPRHYKDKIKDFSSTQIQQARAETLKEVEQIMANTLSADTPNYHKEVGEMYKKLEKLKGLK